jgi:hypothetical protein
MDTTALKSQGLDVAGNVLMMRQDMSDMSSSMSRLVMNANKQHDVDEKMGKLIKNTGKSIETKSHPL